MGKTIGTVLALKDQCTPAISKIAQKFGMTEEAAKKLNGELRVQAKLLDEKLKSAIPAITGAVVAFAGATGVLINNTLQTGDRIDKMSQKMQMSRKTFQEMEYVFAQNGASIEVMQGGMAKLSKAMEGARTGNKANIKTFKQLGISLKDSKGAMKSTETVMFEAVSRLQKMREGARKSTLAMDIFGKSATELAPILNGSAKDVEALRKEYHDLGMGLTDEQIDAAVKLGDTIGAIKKSFQDLALQIGADLLPTFQEMGDKFKKNIPAIKEGLTPVITAFGEAVNFVCNNLDVIIPAVGALVGVFTGLKVVGAVSSLIVAFTNPVGAAVLVIGLLVSAIGVAKAKGVGFFKALKEIFSFIGKGVKTVADLAGAFLNLGNAFNRRNKKENFWTKDLTPSIKAGLEKGAVSAGEKVLTSPPGITAIAVSETVKKIKNRNALGTASSIGGVSLVGEYGPELVNLPRGASVTPTNQTQQILGGRNIDVKLVVNGNIYGEDDFINKIISRFTLELNRVMV